MGENYGPCENVYLHCLSGDAKKAIDFGTFPDESIQLPGSIYGIVGALS
jgi:hypothetical protein